MKMEYQYQYQYHKYNNFKVLIMFSKKSSKSPQKDDHLKVFKRSEIPPHWFSTAFLNKSLYFSIL